MKRHGGRGSIGWLELALGRAHRLQTGGFKVQFVALIIILMVRRGLIFISSFGLAFITDVMLDFLILQ